jgi:hypothetical protein
MTTRIAIREELRLVEIEQSGLLNSLIKEIRDEEGQLDFPPFYKIDIYPSLLDKIGMLEATQIIAIVTAHESIQRSRLVLIAISSEHSSGYYVMPANQFETAQEVLAIPLERVRAAIEVLK